MPSTSPWLREKLAEFPPLQKNAHFDVLVIGGGNTGISTAYVMKEAGLRVGLIEKDRCGSVNTGHTSAHLTCITDLRLSKLLHKLGKDHAQAVMDAGVLAIDTVEANCAKESIECHFARVPGFLHASLTQTEEESKDLEADLKAAVELGIEAVYLQSVPLVHKPGIRVPNQARFHPLKYLQGLLKRIPGDGCQVFENTEITEFSQKPFHVKANGFKVTFDYLVIATDVPLQGNNSLFDATLFQTKIAPYTSYVISAEVSPGSVPDALFWDTSDPYYFLRLEKDQGKEYAIFGGLDHKTGQEVNANERYQQLERLLQKYVPTAHVKARWSGQVVESVDGLPYIGEIADKQFIATGYSGNGLTFGTVAALMACDAARGRSNPWKDLFDPSRKKLSAIWNYMKENADFPYYLIKDRLKKSEAESPDHLASGQGKILEMEGNRVAAFKDEQGKLTLLSPVCTHLGCIVRWNQSEKTWDCPCHGSRFRARGEVFAGPAESPLEPYRSASEVGKGAK
ncbi:MAG: FAD-dependent oxidoreductase [Gemmatales bacterium]